MPEFFRSYGLQCPFIASITDRPFEINACPVTYAASLGIRTSHLLQEIFPQLRVVPVYGLDTRLHNAAELLGVLRDLLFRSGGPQAGGGQVQRFVEPYSMPPT